jgi:hypothetical protein
MDDDNLPRTGDRMHEFLQVDDLRKRKPATIGLVLQRSAFPERKRYHCDHSNCFSRLTGAGQQEVEQVPGASFNSPGRNPEHPRRREGINGPSAPPGDFVSEAVDVTVMGSA